MRKLKQAPINQRPIILDFGPGIHPLIRKLLLDIHERGLSITSVARAAGISNKTLRNWQVGSTSPRIGDLEAVLNTLGYDIEAVKRD